MTEINKAALAQETRLIEYWRKKYLFQAAAVAVCAGAAIAAAAVYIQAKLPALLIILAVLTVAYLMLRELRDSLQILIPPAVIITDHRHGIAIVFDAVIQ